MSVSGSGDIVAFCVGQAGAQIGGELIDVMGSSTTTTTTTSRREKHRTARTRLRVPQNSNSNWRWLFIDSEPKTGPKRAEIRRVFDDSGSGNNWALGFNQDEKSAGKPISGGKKAWNVMTRPSVHGHDGLIKRSIDSLRKTIEECDRLGALMMIHSIGGGTGSGLGSRLIQTVRDTLPKSVIMCSSVLPFQAGDTPLQHYNSVLSLAWLNEYCDGVLIHDNDVMSSIANANKTRSRSIASSSIYSHASSKSKSGFESINSQIINSISGLLYPIRTYVPDEDTSGFKPESGALRAMSIGRLASDCFSYSKFCEVFSCTGENEDGTVKAVIECLPQYTSADADEPGGRSRSKKRVTTVQACLVQRGYADIDMHHGQGHGKGMGKSSLSLSLNKKLNLAKWSQTDGSISVVNSWSKEPFDTPSATLCACTDRLAARFQVEVDRSREMLSAGAYVHWYERYGVDWADLATATDYVEDNVISTLYDISI